MTSAWLRVMGLTLWGAVLLVSSLSGRLDLLLRGAFHPLVAVSGVLLIALAGQQTMALRHTPRAGRQRGAWGWALSALLAIAVLAVPPNPSFSDLAANRSTSGTGEPELDFVLPPAQRSLTDWVRLLRSQPDPALYSGDPVRISGFVLPQSGDRPQLGRLLVRCCLADATPIGLPVRWPAGFTPKADQWLAVQGRMGQERHRGSLRSVVLADRVQPIPQPARPLEP